MGMRKSMQKIMDKVYLDRTVIFYVDQLVSLLKWQMLN